MKSILFQAALLIGLGLFSVPASAATYGGGSGTETQPYRISALGHWQTLMITPTDWDKHFILTANLDFQGLQLTPIGNPATPFIGVFDGQRFVLRNFVINLPNSIGAGLFAYIGDWKNRGGVVKNLGTENVVVTSNWIVGGLAGENHGTIIACSVSGDVIGESEVGGFCGSNYGTISACYSSANVTGLDGIGGFTGGNFGGIYNCYATGDIIADGEISEGAGGFVGRGNGGENTDIVSACFSTGRVMAYGFLVGGFNGGFNIVSNSFWDIQTSEKIKGSLGTGLTTAAMQTADTYLRAYWDFVGDVKNGTEDIWFMPPEGGYPILAWQAAGRFVLANDQMLDATPIAVGASVNGTTVGATGLDITTNGYNDLLDVWYAFDCTATGKYTITLTGVGFDTTLAVFDAKQNEVAFNDEFFGGKSRVILNGRAGKRYYIRVAGVDGQSGGFTLNLAAGATQAIQGDLNYDGKVNLIDLSTLAENWMLGV